MAMITSLGVASGQLQGCGGSPTVQPEVATRAGASSMPSQDPSAQGKPAHGPGQQHTFQGADQWAKVFDAPERDTWMKPEAVIASLKLSADAKVADIGAGTGYFSVRFAKAIPAGRIYGADVEKDMVWYLENRAEFEHYPNIKAVLAEYADAKLPEAVDVAFFCDTVHHIEERPQYFKGLKRYLKPKGRVVFIEYKEGVLPVKAPPPEMRLSAEKLDVEMKAAGYSRARLDVELLPHHYIAEYKL
jgi:ubiquinone/menaquinone biosynthesis C-methylase UbiE